MLWSLEFGQMPYQCPVSVNAALPNPVCGEPCQVRMFVQASYFLLRFSSLASCSWRKSAKGKTCLLLLQTLKQDLFILSFLLRLLLRLYAHQLLFFGEKTRRKKKLGDNMGKFKCRHARKLLENQVAVCILILDLPLLTSSQ